MRKVALLFAAGRAAFGILLLVRPKAIAPAWIGAEDADRPAPEMIVRMIGARDFVVGMGAVLAIVNGGRARGWLEAGVMADLADTVITAAYLGKTPAQGSAVTLGMATVAGAIGYRLATRVDRTLDAEPMDSAPQA